MSWPFEFVEQRDLSPKFSHSLELPNIKVSKYRCPSETSTRDEELPPKRLKYPCFPHQAIFFPRFLPLLKRDPKTLILVLRPIDHSRAVSDACSSVHLTEGEKFFAMVFNSKAHHDHVIALVLVLACRHLYWHRHIHPTLHQPLQLFHQRLLPF